MSTPPAATAPAVPARSGATAREAQQGFQPRALIEQGAAMAQFVASFDATDLTDLPTSAIAPRAASAVADVTAAQVHSSLQLGTFNVFTSQLRLLFGTSFSDVAAAMIKAFAAARHTKSLETLLRDLILAIFVGYTKSSIWVDVYNANAATSLFREFEIEGRLADLSTEEGKAGAWVATSKMNATALHLAAYLIVESATDSGALAKLKSVRGSPFTDLGLQSEQGKLITEAALLVTEEDRDALRAVKDHAGKIPKILDMILQSGASDLEGVLQKAALYKNAEF